MHIYVAQHLALLCGRSKATLAPFCNTVDETVLASPTYKPLSLCSPRFKPQRPEC